jgi:hypothetical protein
MEPESELGESGNLVGRSIQILNIKPDLIIDLLRDLGRGRFSLAELFREDLEGVHVVDCVEVNGMLWLYLEKSGWPAVEADNLPYVRYIYVNYDGKPVTTENYATQD